LQLIEEVLAANDDPDIRATNRWLTNEVHLLSATPLIHLRALGLTTLLQAYNDMAGPLEVSPKDPS
jgi:hypothetical protein